MHIIVNCMNNCRFRCESRDPITTNRVLDSTYIPVGISRDGFSSTRQYDTIRYDTVDLRVLKSWRDGQLNLAHGAETKNNEKIDKVRYLAIRHFHPFRRAADIEVRAASLCRRSLTIVRFPLCHLMLPTQCSYSAAKIRLWSPLMRTTCRTLITKRWHSVT